MCKCADFRAPCLLVRYSRLTYGRFQNLCIFKFAHFQICTLNPCSPFRFGGVVDVADVAGQYKQIIRQAIEVLYD